MFGTTSYLKKNYIENLAILLNSFRSLLSILSQSLSLTISQLKSYFFFLFPPQPSFFNRGQKLCGQGDRQRPRLQRGLGRGGCWAPRCHGLRLWRGGGRTSRGRGRARAATRPWPEPAQPHSNGAKAEPTRLARVR